MRWVTRRNAHIDRTGCPWLIRRFIDPAAEFVFVPADTKLTEIDGIPFDMRGAALGHREGRRVSGWERRHEVGNARSPQD